MNPLTLDEIVDLPRYAALRDPYRKAVIAHKAARRIGVGDKMTIVFEDRETLRFQVQEMLWVERIADPERVQDELDVYNALLPDRHELSATLFIEITDLDRIRPELDRLLGIDECVSLVLSADGREESVVARFDADQMEEDRISAVHYLRFQLSPEQAARFADPAVNARLRVDHPAYRHETELPPAMRESLVSGLTAAPSPLLPSAGDLPEPPADEILFETPTVRALRPARPGAEGHVIVEPIARVASLLEADPALLAELLDAVQRVAGEVTKRYGACRVSTQIGGGADGLRFHVHAAGG